jgi:hydroxymethylpyrimidine/phosphomethylpyrimidine kinase
VHRPAVLVIAATDSSGGAGLTRDVRVLTDFAVDALCVVTAVTAQSDKTVSAVHHVPPDVIRAQIAAALATRGVGAIKIGMLGTQASVEAVVAGLLASGLTLGGGRPHTIPLIVDPVLVSTSGGVLLDAGGQAALTGSLFRMATLITPNVPEAAALLGEALAADEAELIQQGARLLAFGSQAILLKGGHRYAGRGADEDAVDLLISRAAARDRPALDCSADASHGVGRLAEGGSALGRSAIGSPAGGRSTHARPMEGLAEDRSEVGRTPGDLLIDRIASKRVVGSSRGTGCALASAIAAGLASGKSLSEACRAAKSYVLGMLAPAPGRAPVS